MKMSKRTYESLKSFVTKHESESARQSYRDRDFERSENVKDLDKRYRFDWFWEWFRSSPENANMIALEDLTSDHIYTALKKIIKPL